MTAGPAWLQRFDIDEVADDGAAADGHRPLVAVKDAIDIAGWVTTCASRALADAAPAVTDASCVTALRRSGGRVAGKTNLTELCWFADGVNELTGTPVNPVDPSRIPGGSSSGSAVVVALGEADLALGTDTGGSVRIPAACCGVAGLKTSRGRVSKVGVFPLAPELDTVGPIARDVAGLVTAMALLEPGFRTEERMSGLRPTVLRLRLDGFEVDPVVDAAVDEAVAAADWRVRDLAVRSWGEVAWESSRILAAGAGKAHAHLLERPDLLSDRARANIESGLGQAPERVARSRQLLADLGRTLTVALGEADAVVLPTLAAPPPSLAEDHEIGLTFLTVPFNVLGWPAVAVPAWAPRGDGVVPPSVQLAGVPRSEERLLAMASRLPSQQPVG